MEKLKAMRKKVGACDGEEASENFAVNGNVSGEKKYDTKTRAAVEKIYDVTIDDISYDGAGVGKVDGKVIFVPKTLPGEHVRVRVTRDGAKFAVGECVQVLEAAPARVKPVCPFFDICGGCDFQHCDYEIEQRLKKKILARELKKAGYAGQINFVPSPRRFHYRNKIKFEINDGKIGYFMPKTHTFFDIDTCPISDERIVNALDKVKNFLCENKLEGLKNVYFRVEKEVQICFLFDKNCKNCAKNVQKTPFFELFDVYFAFGDVLESDKTKLVHLSRSQSGSDPRAFRQVNDEVAAKLYAHVLDSVDGKRVVNAYSGQGALTLQIAQRAKFVYGIEMQKSAHNAAERLCSCVENVKNVCGKVEDKIGEVAAEVDLIVLDPARSGCEKSVLEEISKHKIHEIVYISCNFASLVRDLQALSDYEISEVTIFDMFPCTANMEVFAKLTKISTVD